MPGRRAHCAGTAGGPLGRVTWCDSLSRDQVGLKFLPYLRGARRFTLYCDVAFEESNNLLAFERL